MCGRGDNQEVGSEAAILERVRNSSLVKWSCADNSAGLKRAAEAADPPLLACRPPWGVVGAAGGRGASRVGGSFRVTGGGPRGSENAGMSSDTGVGSPGAV